MGKFYKRETIDHLLSVVSFEAVLTHYDYPIKGRGKNRGSTCPSCGKNDQHFKINSYKNLAQCFVCGFKGNVLHFIQKVEGINFIQSVEKCAEIGQYKLPENNQKNPLTVQDKILYYAMSFYKTHSSNYLKERGISEQVIQDKQIGYAPGGTALKDHLIKKNFSASDLLDSGLIIKRNGELRDFFYQCVIIPIFKKGIVVDLYGRHIGSSKIKHLYLKGDFILYNGDNIRDTKNVLAVESIINALSAISHGIKDVVAVGGASKFSKQHAAILRAKGIRCVYNAFDTGDLSGSGQKGAIEAGRILKESGIDQKVVQFPKGIDLNVLLNTEGLKEFKNMLADSQVTDEYELRYKLDQMPDEWIIKYAAGRNL